MRFVKKIHGFLQNKKFQLIDGVAKVRKYYSKKDNRADFLLYLSLFILFSTTLQLNYYVAMYLLSAILFAFSIFTYRFGD